jgi:hypothetical protein
MMPQLGQHQPPGGACRSTPDHCPSATGLPPSKHGTAPPPLDLPAELHKAKQARRAASRLTIRVADGSPGGLQGGQPAAGGLAAAAAGRSQPGWLASCAGICSRNASGRSLVPSPSNFLMPASLLALGLLPAGGNEADVESELGQLEQLLRQAWGHGAGIQTEAFIRLLGLDNCRDTVAGGPMLRGLSGGVVRRPAAPAPGVPLKWLEPLSLPRARCPPTLHPSALSTSALPCPPCLAAAPAGERKRLSTAEMLVGPRRVLLMDEISTGLDSATLYNNIQALGMTTHGLELTTVVSLLQVGRCRQPCAGSTPVSPYRPTSCNTKLALSSRCGASPRSVGAR